MQDCKNDIKDGKFMCKYCNKSNKKWIIWLIAGVAALAGIAVAVGAYLKKHAAFLNDTLDYDDELFYEDEDYCEDELHDLECMDGAPQTQAPSSSKEDMIENAFNDEDDTIN